MRGRKAEEDEVLVCPIIMNHINIKYTQLSNHHHHTMKNNA